MPELNETTLKTALNIIKRSSEFTLKQLNQNERIKKQTFVLYSLPGVGKTEGLRNLAQSKNHIAVIDVNAEFGGSLSMPIQHVEGEKARVLHALHEDIAKLNEHAKQHPDEVHYLFLDEFNRGDDFMKQTLMQLLLNQTLPGHPLEQNIFVVGAGNTSENIFTDENIENDVNPLDVAARDRIAPLFVKLDANQWLDWAYQQGIHPYIITFLENNQNIQNAIYKAPASDDQTGATPRSWEKLSHLFKEFNPANEHISVMKPLIQSIIGSELTDEFIHHLSNKPNFDINDILKDSKEALSKFENLTSPEARQALLMMPPFIENKLKHGDKSYLDSFSEILETNDQTALVKFIKIFVENDILRQNFPTLYSEIVKLDTFKDLRSYYSSSR